MGYLQKGSCFELIEFKAAAGLCMVACSSRPKAFSRSRHGWVLVHGSKRTGIPTDDVSRMLFSERGYAELA
jgi:hypothetical protein